jgi:H+/Cl- antiporter ClcA
VDRPARLAGVLVDAVVPGDLPAVGAAVVVAARTFLPGDGGHSPLAGIGGGVTPLRYAPGVALAALGTLAFGAVLGPEAPLISLGSAVGMAVTLLVRLGPQEERVVATAGSFSAISALFGRPLVAGMLLLEGSVGLGASAIPALLTGLVAAAVGYLIFIGFGDWGGVAGRRSRSRVFRCTRERRSATCRSASGSA